MVHFAYGTFREQYILRTVHFAKDTFCVWFIVRLNGVSPGAGGASPEPQPVAAGAEGVAVVWAVTDLSAVPAGAIVLHPQVRVPITCLIFSL